MGTAVALGNILEPNVIGVIDSFLDDSSTMSACGSETSNLTRLDELPDFCLWSPGERVNQRLQEHLYMGSLEYPNRL